MRHHLNFNSHIILPQPRHAHTSPKWLMIWHILLKIPDHGIQRFFVDGDMVRFHAEDLLPPFAASVLQIQLDVLERLVDLLVDLFIELPSVWVPAACNG